MSQVGPRLQRIAVAAAVLAVVVAVAGVVVVARRGPPGGAPVTRRLRADALAVLGADTVAQAGHGVRPTGAVAATLGLASDDTLVAISGRAVTSPAELAAVLHQLDALQPDAWFVDLERAGGRELERWQIDGDVAAARRARPADATASDPLITTIRRLDVRTYEIPRATVEAWTAEPARITAGIAQATRADHPRGFQLQVRPGSVVAALGLQSGDVVRGINGSELDSAGAVAKAAADPAAMPSVDAIAALIARSDRRITLDLWRGGQSVILSYLIR